VEKTNFFLGGKNGEKRGKKEGKKEGRKKGRKGKLKIQQTNKEVSTGKD